MHCALWYLLSKVRKMLARLSLPWMMWYLKLCDNLTGCGDVQISGWPLFLDVSVKVFPNETSIWIQRLGKVDCLPLDRWASSNPSEGLNRTKRWRKGWFTFSPCLTPELGHPTCKPATLGSQAFWFRLNPTAPGFPAPRPSLYTICFPGSPTQFPARRSSTNSHLPHSN